MAKGPSSKAAALDVDADRQADSHRDLYESGGVIKPHPFIWRITIGAETDTAERLHRPRPS
jgi:hypothetical protein